MSASLQINALMDSSSQIIYCESLKSPNILEKKAARSLKSLNTITDFIAQKKKNTENHQH